MYICVYIYIQYIVKSVQCEQAEMILDKFFAHFKDRDYKVTSAVHNVENCT